MPRFYQPYLNPVEFFKKSPDTIAQYVSKHIDDHLFVRTILPWQQKVGGLQLWQINDTVNLQFQSTYGPVNLSLYTCEGGRIHTVSVSAVRQNMDDPTRFIYQVSLSLQAFDPGIYYFQIEAGSPASLILISNPFKLSEKTENTLLLGYRHHSYKDDIFFETGFSPSVRLPGNLLFKSTDAAITTYEDQEADLEILKQVDYDLWSFTVGLSAGIPPGLFKRIARMMGCSTTTLDGREYSRNADAKWEETVQENYPMKGWSLEMRTKIRRSSVIYENDAVVTGQMSVIVVADSKGFNTEGSGSNYFVEDVQ